MLGKTQAECKAKLKKAIEESKALDISRANEYTVATWLRTWFELYAKPHIRPSTMNYYHRNIEQHVAPAIGDIPLNKLTTRDLQKLYNDLQSNGRLRKVQKKKKPGLSNSTVRGIHMMLHNALDRAVKEKLILSNPTENCIIPKIEKQEMKILHPDHISAYLANEYTVATWLRTWFELYAKPHIRPSTMNYYHRNIEQHVAPAIGDIPLNKLTTRDLQKLYNDLQSNGRLRKVQKKKKPGLSNSTVRGIHMMLHNALDRAVKEKLILSNPTENCIIPKIEKQEMKILHPDHISAYLDAAEQRGALPMFYLELVSGLRKGELVALQWSDLDEANCTISVSKQASWDTEGNLILSQPKTGNSIREVSIPQDAVELLKQEHAKHPDNPWMFPSSRTGEMYHPDSVVNLHKKILKDAGLEHIRFHDLRHTFATLALQNGVDVKTVSSMLGHYDAGFTLRTYTHATRQMQQKAAEKMGSFMAQIR